MLFLFTPYSNNLLLSTLNLILGPSGEFENHIYKSLWSLPSNKMHLLQWDILHIYQEVNVITMLKINIR